FPRTIPQAEALSDFAQIDAAINFSLPDEEIVKRLSGRRVHPGSGRTYHVLFNPPEVEGKDDLTGEDLVTRPDDEVEAIRNRLEVYKEQTEPLIDYYDQKNLLITVDASPKPDEVFESLTAAIDELR
ncbi:MAG: adenylate kinase family protein, partial [Alkalispirochaetaceae bacterium]